MGFISGVVQLGVVVAVAGVVRREMQKPENQQKVRELVDKVQTRVRSTTR